MVSATAAGWLPSTTHTTVCALEVGFCGDTNTAPSGPSAAVTASAEKGSGIGALTENGPDVDTDGREVGTVVVVDEGVVPAAATVPRERDELWALGDAPPHAAMTSAAAATVSQGCT
jgi:hypothetical protein